MKVAGAWMFSMVINGTILGGLAWLNRIETPPVTPYASVEKAVRFDAQPPPQPRDSDVRAHQAAVSPASLLPPPTVSQLRPRMMAATQLPSSFGTALGDVTGVVYGEDGVDEPAKFLSGPTPVYPRMALARRQSGFVQVRLLVDEQGKVQKAEILESSPSGVFDDAALDAVRAYRFEPARVGTQAVPAWKRKRIEFRYRQ